MIIMTNLEWPMFSYYMIDYEKFKKVIQWTEKEALTHLYKECDESVGFYASTSISTSI